MADRHTKQPTKRMRLGTKSCSECRRRKVRCIFAPGNSVCQSCALHNTSCNAQQPRIEVNGPENGNNVLQQRINDLEGLVKSLAATVGVATTPNKDVNEHTTQISPSSTIDAGWPLTEHPLSATNPSDAPLINLFRNALLIGDADGRIQDDGGTSKASAPRGREPSSNLSPYIPDEPTVRSILRTTQKYWCTLPPCYYGPEPHQTFLVNRDSEGEDCLVKRLTHQHLDTGFCIALLWLALCIQQLPMDWFRYNLPNSPSKQDLLTSYLAYCRLILAGAGMENLDTVQCHLLQFKLYINMGMPQKAWNCTRSAISTATLLGLNRLNTDAKESHKMIWLLSLTAERQLSLVLGYPSAVQTTTKTPFGPLPMALDGPVAYRILYSLALVHGDVINRDQGSSESSKSYATTIKMDDDLEELRKLFPVEWWDPSSLSDDSLGEFYYREVAKFLYFLLIKFVHLPYMLRSIHDTRYEHSRQSVLNAAREQIRCYVRLRNFPGAEILVCEVMDFNVFSAGMALIIGTLYMPSPAYPLNVLSEDGSLIESLIASLRQTALLLDCPVAEQGARVLELLINTRPSAGDRQIELTVPYFGNLKVKLPELNNDTGSVPSITSSQPSSISGRSFSSTAIATPATVEFSTNEFVASVAEQFKQGDELRQDWFGIFDTGACYDWQQTLTRMQIDG